MRIDRARSRFVVALSLVACGATPSTTADDGGDPALAPSVDASPLDAAAPAVDATLPADAAPPVDAAGPRADASSAVDAGDAGAAKYGADGPVAFTKTTATLTNGASTFTETIYMPSTPGLHPLVSLSPGLQQPAAAYAPFATRLASWGIATIVRDDPGVFVGTNVVVDDLTYTVATWAPTALAGEIDAAKIGLVGHSRGGRSTLLAAEAGLKGKVVAWFGLDPVTQGVQGDTTADPTGAVGALGIPTTYLGASVTSSCSPAAFNYQVLYAATSAPSVEITGIGAGHTQFEDPASCAECFACTPAGTADTHVVLAYAVRYVTSFFARELLGDAAVGPLFEGAGAPADVAAGLVTLASK